MAEEKNAQAPVEQLKELKEVLNRVSREIDGRGQERPRLTREQILERKINMVRERGSRVLRINSPLGHIMCNILRQFDVAYAQFKGQLGEPGGITYEEGSQLMAEARDVAMAFSDMTRKLSRKVRVRYFVPDELMNVNNGENQTGTKASD